MNQHIDSWAQPSRFRHYPRRGPQFVESTREPWERLQRALDAAPGWAVPCRDDGHSGDWISEDRAAQARAAAACAGCPLIDACRDYATIARRTSLWGVWGGRQYTAGTTREEPAATAVGA